MGAPGGDGGWGEAPQGRGVRLALALELDVQESGGAEGAAGLLTEVSWPLKLGWEAALYPEGRSSP